ncbi:hypothetical protein HHK36_017723 [Tetracentron sinense]|uniref:Uncharacterized protein n=1 Tax=Tetracentron sinense TaxID=13715 RepID=A0A834Z2I5_TETSI|nr:hypothetical protein HHK36_017723 [Tetracentron sinense]
MAGYVSNGEQNRENSEALQAANRTMATREDVENLQQLAQLCARLERAGIFCPLVQPEEHRIESRAVRGSEMETWIFEYICCSLWIIYRKKKLKYFSSEQAVLHLQMYYFIIFSLIPGSTMRKLRRIEPIDVIMLSFDLDNKAYSLIKQGSKLKSTTGVGIIIGDHWGSSLFGQSFAIDASSARIAAAKALFIGLTITEKARGGTALSLKGDALQLLCFPRTIARAIPRSANGEAHILAKRALRWRQSGVASPCASVNLKQYLAGLATKAVTGVSTSRAGPSQARLATKRPRVKLVTAGSRKKSDKGKQPKSPTPKKGSKH